MDRNLLMLLVVGVLLVYLAMVYNRLVRLRNQVRNGYAQIDVQLQRRYDLIPNLVESAKAYLAHERETLEAVIVARNQAQALAQAVATNPLDEQAMGHLIAGEGALQGALGRLFALAEAYPDLKADRSLAQLSEELTATENRVAFARQAYNDAVMGYNTRIESVPDVLIAGPFDFKAATLWQVEEAAVRTAPRIDLH